VETVSERTTRREPSDSVVVMTLPPNDLPPTAFGRFQNLSDDQKVAFASRYGAAKRSMPLMMALAILFPIQLFLLNRILLGLLFLLTGGGFGVWYVVEWFLTPGRVRDYNTKLADDVLASMDGESAGRTDVEED
jgi:hypothetical protein